MTHAIATTSPVQKHPRRKIPNVLYSKENVPRSKVSTLVPVGYRLARYDELEASCSISRTASERQKSKGPVWVEPTTPGLPGTIDGPWIYGAGQMTIDKLASWFPVAFVKKDPVPVVAELVKTKRK